MVRPEQQPQRPLDAPDLLQPMQAMNLASSTEGHEQPTVAPARQYPVQQQQYMQQPQYYPQPQCSSSSAPQQQGVRYMYTAPPSAEYGYQVMMDAAYQPPQQQQQQFSYSPEAHYPPVSYFNGNPSPPTSQHVFYTAQPRLVLCNVSVRHK
jgi:hypothetical protein